MITAGWGRYGERFPPGPPVVQLSIGPTPAGRIIAIVLAGIPLVLAVGAGGAAAVRLATDPERGDVDAFAVVRTTFCVLVVVALFGYMLLSVIRTKFWLEGTTVARRSVFTTRRVDLAVADVSGDAMPFAGPGIRGARMTVPFLLARDPRTGAFVRIMLRGRGLKRLPAWELTAIADAIMAHRVPSDPNYPAAAALAEEIRKMAVTPFPV